jgi:hypothetical protein
MMTSNQRASARRNLFTSNELSLLLGLDGLTYLLESEGSNTLPAREMFEDQITWKTKDIIRWATMKDNYDFVKDIVDVDDYAKVELCPDTFRTANIADLPNFGFQAIARGHLTPCTLVFHIREQAKSMRVMHSAHRKFVVGMLAHKLERELRADYVVDAEKIRMAVSEALSWSYGNNNGIWMELGATSKRITLRLPNRVCFRKMQGDVIGGADIRAAMKGIATMGKVRIPFALDHGCKEVDVKKYLISAPNAAEHIRKILVTCVEDYGISTVEVDFDDDFSVGVDPVVFRRRAFGQDS